MNNWVKISRIAFVTGTVVFVLGQWIFSGGFNQPLQVLLLNFAIFQLYAFVLAFINILFFDYINKKFSNENYNIKRLLIGFFGSMFLTILGLIVLRYFVIVYINDGDPSTIFNNYKGYFLFGITVTIIVSLLFHLFYFYKAWSEKKVVESQVVAKTETAKYEVLKSQLDPHFLFNSLNVLTSLIGENPALAEKFTTKLSKVYRYVLEQKNKDLISLDEELKFAHTYMELLKMRFEDAVIFNIPNNSSHESYKIVPLSLQLLLENAVKHNVITSENPLRIDILEKDGFLVITNNLNKKSILEKGTKVGLNNIIERYGLITKKNVEVIISEGNFIVKLPLLTQKIKEMRTNINEESRYFRARKQVKELKEFYGSLVSYVIVMPFLIFIWYRYTSNTIQWFWFPMLGWGFGLVVQGLKVFGYNALFGNNWEERKIQELMDEDKKQYWE